tara:strand:- start:1064 stop:1855 length:792 start_codon:yes stop_codon:yes gene_type:complete
MKIIETEGIVLKTMDFKEKDIILTFLTKDLGKKAGVLHGGKSISSGNAAKAELFVLNHFEFVEKMNNDLVNIKKCELINSFQLLRRNYTNFLHANYFSELLLKCEIPEIESNNYFEMFKKTISKLVKSNNGVEIKFDFELKLMKFLGIIPYFEKCIKCNGHIWERHSKKIPIPKYSKIYQLDASLGGIRCPKCRIMDSVVTDLNPGSIAFFYSKQKNEQNNSLIKPTFNNLKELDKAFLIYFRYFFGKNLRSHALLQENLWKN